MGNRALVAVSLLAVGCGRAGFDTGFDDIAAVEQPNLVFVTSTTHSPMEFGRDLAGADAICAEHAESAGLPGTYVAWLSSSAVEGRDRLAGARGWARVDGRPVADRIEDLIAGRMFHPIRTDEYGEDVGNVGALVATGTTEEGARSSRTCADYTDPADVLRIGEPWSTAVEWTNEGTPNADCTTPRRLYCFGVDRNVKVAPIRATGRLAFVTTTPFSVGGGLDAADAHCKEEARLALLDPEKFLALLGTDSMPAIARFDLLGAPWIRGDGALLADLPVEFMAGKLHTSLAIDQLGDPLAADVFTGGDPRTTNSSCASWTMPSTDSVRTGWSSGTNDSVFFDEQKTCDIARPIYCLEN